MRALNRWLIGACGEYKVDASLRCTIEEKPVTIKPSPCLSRWCRQKMWLYRSRCHCGADSGQSAVRSLSTCFTEITRTLVRLSILEVYRGSTVTGKPVELVISGWLESEKKEAALFKKAMKEDKEVVVIMEKSYSLHQNRLPLRYRLSRGSHLPRYRAPYDANDNRSA